MDDPRCRWLSNGADLLLNNRSVPTEARGRIPCHVAAKYPSAKSCLTLSSATLTPNPASRFAEVKFKLEQNSEVQVGMYNLMGTQVKRKILGALATGSHRTSLDLDGLVPGIYFVKIEVDGKWVAKKLVVN